MTNIGNIVQVRTAAQVRDAILAELAALLGISDQNLGGAIRTMCYAFGVELDAFYYQLWRGTRSFYIRTASGYALSQRAQDYSLIREPATKATGYITVYGSNGTAIPLGTIVAVPASDIADQIRFVTTVAATIPVAGYVEVAVEAEVAGSAGNVAASTITELVSTVAGVTSVTNDAGTRLGLDEEDDATLRERILRTIAGLSRGTVPSIKNGAQDFRIQELSLSGSIDDAVTVIPVDQDLNLFPIATSGTVWLGSEAVTYTGLDLSARPHKLTGCTRGTNGTSPASHGDAERIREYVPAGRGERVTSLLLEEDFSNGHVDVTIDDSTSLGASSELVSLVQGRLRGDGTQRNGGYRGAGITLDVHAATQSTVTIAITIAVKSGYVTATVQTAVEDNIVRAINALGVDAKLYGYVLSCVAQSTEGVETVKSLTINGTTFDGADTADQTPPSRGVLRTTASDVTVST